ncbi:MAG: hypothetical protein HOE90_13085 [Bacteriovoracaceae bacterium]|jgi:cytochrome c oxidase subunit II|nr:hypothetical protein [Bacteriovoracaceae bacterium]
MLDWIVGYMPENIATFGEDIDYVINLIGYIVFIWWILAEGVLFYFLFSSRKKEGVKATYEDGSTMKAMSWVLIPVVLVLGFDLFIDYKSHSAWDKIKIQLPKADVVYRVMGQQFAWTYTHPGVDGKFGTGDDFEPDDLVVPVHQVVHTVISALDVIHSLWIPNLRFKQDSVPGRIITGWFEATKTGDYPIACAELCGTGHGVMASTLKVLEADAYKSWVAQQSAAALAQ